MEGLSKEAKQSAYDRQVKLLQDHTVYAAPDKIVSRSVRRVVNPDGPIKMIDTTSETDVESRQNYAFTQNGLGFKTWGTGGRGGGGLRNFVGKDYSRYHHLAGEYFTEAK